MLIPAAFWLGPIGRAAQPPPQAGPSLALTVGAILDKYATGGVSVAATVVRDADDSVVFVRDGSRPMIPASNEKLVTTAAALHYLHPEHVFRTRLLRDGPVHNGILRGSLVLVGSGDPLLSCNDLRAMAQAVAASGIRRIRGGVAFDDTAFDRRWLGPGWKVDDEPWYYAAEVDALCCNGNIEDVQVLPGARRGEHASVIVAPLPGYFRVRNTCRTVGTGPTSVRVSRERGHNTLLVSGSIALGSRQHPIAAVGVTVVDPARFAAAILRQALRDCGIRCSNAVTEIRRPGRGAALIVEHRSPPMTDIVYMMNKPSDNLIAECLLKAVGAEASGKGTAGPRGSGASAALAYLRQLGVDTSGLTVADGSGLSTANRISSDALAHLMRAICHAQWHEAAERSLPIAGVDGTMKRRLKGTAAMGRCVAKTGSEHGVSTVTGTVLDGDGHRLCFSILMNGAIRSYADARSVQDRVILALAASHGN